VTLEEQEVHLYALEVLEDEDEDHDHDYDSDHERGPRSAEARLSLTRELRGIHHLAVSILRPD
jgi:hypothetical protein